MDCPNGHGRMELINAPKEIIFRGEMVNYRAKHFVCSKCGLEADDLKLASENQKALSDGYRAVVNLLTSDEIKKKRNLRGWTQEDLANAANVGIASVKRWESGQIQTKSMDEVLRKALTEETNTPNILTGNRPLSLNRIKLVFSKLGSLLTREMLKKDPQDKMLYSAKYLWYADMAAYRDLSRSMTGATYAALPMGPQLNNYNDLVDQIKEADINQAEPLSDKELKILTRVARVLPTDRAAYRAAHKEPSFISKTAGELIPYSDARTIKAI
jgi:putative zinc finger/helix-turn-helix YgiT family protein